jgi:hypothetical protein
MFLPLLFRIILVADCFFYSVRSAKVEYVLVAKVPPGAGLSPLLEKRGLDWRPALPQGD